MALCACRQDSRWGFAAYDARTAVLQAFHDKRDDAHLSNVTTMIQTLKPSVVLIHSSVEAKMKQILREQSLGMHRKRDTSGFG